MRKNPSNRPRRKAKQERSRQTVQALLEAAARVLDRHGYAGASTNRIAQTAGASVGTLYEYFPNKEAIFDALIRQEIESLVTAVRAAGIRPDAPLRDTLLRVLELAMTAMRHGPDFMRSLEQVPGEVFRSHMMRARALVTGFIREVLEAHRQELQVSDLDLAAFIVVSAAEGIGANVSDERFGDLLAEEVATLLNLYLTGQDVRR